MKLPRTGKGIRRRGGKTCPLKEQRTRGKRWERSKEAVSVGELEGGNSSA